MKCSLNSIALLVALATSVSVRAAEDTLPPLEDGRAPQTFEELWAPFDPRKEPLETEVLKDWEEDGVVLRVVRFRIGVFKGQKAMLAGVYGFPKGAQKLPGLLQIHGGGQYADYKAPLTNAKRGYATLSIAWAGRISAPGYAVTPDVVALFWEGKTNDPKYRVTTDWGKLDGYHAPCRNPKNQFGSVAPAAWTLDDVESPRNNSWFLCTLAARRALTFLEQQPEVDPEKLGVYGHSMGGKLTVLTAAADSRVKAAAPSCGGISDRPTDNRLYAATIADGVNLQHVACPIIFLSPANDFHGRINDLEKAIGEIRSPAWRVTCSAHHNHQDTEPYQVAGPLWFDQHLKGTFSYPQDAGRRLAVENNRWRAPLHGQAGRFEESPVRGRVLHPAGQGQRGSTRPGEYHRPVLASRGSRTKRGCLDRGFAGAGYGSAAVGVCECALSAGIAGHGCWLLLRLLHRRHLQPLVRTARRARRTR